MKRRRVVYIVSDIDKALAFEWIAKRISKETIDLSFVLMNKDSSHLEQFLDANKIPFRRISFSPGWKLIFPMLKIWLILIREKPHVVHTHLRYATIVGLTSSFLAGVKHRIHTRHHATSNHRYYPHAVKVDKLINKLSSKIVSISDVVSRTMISLENVPPSKIIKIPHGFDLSYFEKKNEDDIRELIRKYNVHKKTPVIGIISRYLELKGIDFGILAFKKLKKTYPDALLILANANGAYKSEIKKLLNGLDQNSYIEIEFEPKLNALYQLFDVFLHLPIYKDVEAFGQTYVEAMAAGIPSVVTLSGIGNEIIEDEKNALAVPYKDAEATYLAIRRVLEDISLKNALVENGKLTAKEFSVKPFISRLENLYSA